MVPFKLIIISLVFISIFNNVLTGDNEINGHVEPDTKNEKEVSTENKTSSDEMTVEASSEDETSSYTNEETDSNSEGLEACKTLLDDVFYVDDEDGKSNFSISYQNLIADSIGINVARKVNSTESTAPTNEEEAEKKLGEFKIRLMKSYFHYLIDEHGLDLRSLTTTPKNFCHEIVMNEQSSKELVAVCKGLMETIGITDPDTASVDFAFRMLYKNLCISILSYEGLTGIKLDDHSVVVQNTNTKKNRRIKLNSKFDTTRDADRWNDNYHTTQERLDLEVYINMFLRPYFYYFLKFIDVNDETSTAFKNVRSFCEEIGETLIITNNINVKIVGNKSDYSDSSLEIETSTN